MNYLDPKEFGAKADGSDATEAIQKAINVASNKGLNHVMISKGAEGDSYSLHGSLRLPSDFIFEMQPGTRLLRRINKRGARTATIQSKVGDTKNITLRNVTIESMLGMDGSFCFFENTTTLRIEKCTFLNSGGGFCVWIRNSSDIHIENVTIDNPKVDKAEFNDDGIHLAGTQNVVVKNCNIRTWDDAIALYGLAEVTMDWRNITISDCECVSRRARMIALVLQEPSTADIHDVVIQNIVGEFNTRAICIESTNPKREIRNVKVSNVLGRGNAFSRDNAGLQDYKAPQKFEAIYIAGTQRADGTSNISEIDVRDVVIEDAPYGSAKVARSKNVTLSDVHIASLDADNHEFAVTESENVNLPRSAAYLQKQTPSLEKKLPQAAQLRSMKVFSKL